MSLEGEGKSDLEEYWVIIGIESFLVHLIF